MRLRIITVLLAAGTMFTISYAALGASLSSSEGSNTMRRSENDYRTVGSIEELIDTAPVIVVGNITSAGEVVNMARNPQDITQADPNVFVLGQTYKLKVERYIKGNGPSDLNVVQAEGFMSLRRGGELPQTEEEIQHIKQTEEYMPIKLGARYIFFLEELQGFDRTLNYMSMPIAAGHPWRFALTDQGMAQPESPVLDANARLGKLSVQALFTKIEQRVHQESRTGRS